VIEDVVIDRWASPEEARAIEEAFARAGFSVEVERAIETRSAGAVPWIIYVTLTVPIAAFLGKFASEAGKDAYATVKAWAKEIIAARRESPAEPGSVRIDDPDGTNLILSAAIPDDALEALADIDWSDTRGGYIMWDADAREWRDMHPRRD
jgi:hypothetical protein